jgi:geranylgeranyl pyrophosphate synthase
MNPIANHLIDQALLRHVEEFKYREGKRIRGKLVQICFGLAGGDGRFSEKLAQSIECLHTGSLIVDDIQDGSSYRRGEPTLHNKIGVPLAINTGNWMYFKALELLDSTSLPMHQQAQLISAMVKTGRRCHEGQAIDLYARLDRIPVSEWRDTAEAISTLKTGALVELAIYMGCVAAGACTVLTTALTTFGNQIGIALQMRNDLDELVHFANTSLDDRDAPLRDDDLRNLRITWPWVWAAEKTSDSLCNFYVQQVDRSDLDRLRVAKSLVEVVLEYGNNTISSLIDEQLRLLGEHVVDQERMRELRDCLSPVAKSHFQHVGAVESRAPHPSKLVTGLGMTS